MGVIKPGSDATPGTVARHLEQLTIALFERGLVAEVVGARTVWAKNSAADPQGAEPHAAMMSPGLRQMVVCQHDTGSGELAWFWVWSGLTREAPPDLEYLCPAQDVDKAAHQIARVLRLHAVDVGPEA